MSNIYQHRPGLPDTLLGHVEEDGKVFRSASGPDDRVGRVDLKDGKIYASRLGPEQYYGRVDLESGRVYKHVVAGADDYVGRVNKSGRIDGHEALGPDSYLGKIKPPQSLAHAGAAMLLLILPAVEKKKPAD